MNILLKGCHCKEQWLSRVFILCRPASSLLGEPVRRFFASLPGREARQASQSSQKVEVERGRNSLVSKAVAGTLY